MRKEIEILAPAGSIESLKAAINAGADAVYTGGTMFGARAYANNLSEEMLLEAIDYVHLHGKKIYLTVNTLLKERELEEKLYNYLLPYYKQGLDAVIVQDVGVLTFIKKHFPDLPIHASTQMTITGAEGAKLLEKQGVHRVVTARELSLQEVKRISDAVDIEIESFVHGALCYCYSGQCLFSSFLGGRSGNRGQCAQPCRLLYQAEGEKKSEYLLSLKDICTLEMIPDLVDAGIYSFKIEGRMKKPEYVAAVASSYRKYADLYLKLLEEAPEKDAHAYAKKHYRVAAEDKEMLLDMYNRGGFHTGYYKTRNGREMVSLTRPNHAGVPAVKVERKQGRMVFGKALTNISAQDVIELPIRKGQEKADTYTCKSVVAKGREIQIPVFADTPFQKGEIWNRTRNAALIDVLQKQYIDAKIKEKINGKLILSKDEHAKLTVEFEGWEVTVSGDVVQEAQNQPMDAARIEKQMRKTGNTEFEFAKLSVEINGNIFLPMQSLNNIRREALEKLEALVVTSYRRDSEICPALSAKGEKHSEPFQYTASALTMEQVHVLANSPLIKRVYVDAVAISKIWSGNGISELVDYVHSRGKEIYLIMPYIFRKDAAMRYEDNFTVIFDTGWDGVLVRNYESFEFLKKHHYEGFIMTDYNMYQFNQYGKEFWKKLDVAGFTAPLELTVSELNDMGLAGGELVGYGYFPMMVSAGCVKKTMKNCRKESGQMTITDRYRKSFVVKNECDYCYNVIYNHVPLYLGDLMYEVRKINPQFVRLMFTTETAEEAKRVLKLYEEERAYPDSNFTRGHWKKGII